MLSQIEVQSCSVNCFKLGSIYLHGFAPVQNIQFSANSR